MRTMLATAVACLSVLGASVASGADATVRKSISIPAQDLGSALRTLEKDRNLQLIFLAEDINALRTQGVSGELTIDEALRQLLQGTGLTFRFLDENTVSVLPLRPMISDTSERTAIRSTGEPAALSVSDPKDPNVMRLSQMESDQETVPRGEAAESDKSAANAATVKKEDEEDPERSGIPEILVTGSKVLNTDIRRTEDDVQPYIVFDRKTLETSGAATLDDFFKQQLTMNVSSLSNEQFFDAGGRSSINLRGLGSDETLILMDGRRVAQFALSGAIGQSDINGVPLSAIERIEVLPTTASGIYGGSATGGVINIVRRRDYAGVNANLTYGNTFDSDVTSRRVDMSAGFAFENGRTNVSLTTSYSDANPLLQSERDFIRRGRQHILANNPAAFFNAPGLPLGATPNIRSALVNGARPDLTLDNGTPLNSPITFVPEGYAGPATDTGMALVSNAGQLNLEQPDTAQRLVGGRRSAILATPETKSVMVTLRRDFTSRIQAFLDLQGSDRFTSFPSSGAVLNAVVPADASSNPFQQAIQVAVPTVGLDDAHLSESKSRNAVIGAIIRLSGKWQASTDFTWSRSQSRVDGSDVIAASTITAVNNGSLDVLRDLNQFPVSFELAPSVSAGTSPREMTLQAASLRIAGPLPLSLPAGDVTLSALLEHREEQIDDIILFSRFGQTLLPRRDQSVGSLYMEATAPLVSTNNKRRGIELLELQLAARRDDYSVRGATAQISVADPTPIDHRVRRDSSTDPTFGLRYKPLQDLTFRGSYATGYRPPSMWEIVPDTPSSFSLSSLTDPLRGGEALGTVSMVSGGNPNLQPEISKSWSAGVVATPRSVPQLRLSADWSRIEKSDNISFLFFTNQGGLNEGIQFFPERIIRGAPSGGFAVGPIIEMDNTLFNMTRLNFEAVDLGLDYEWATDRFGTFEVSANATRVIHAEVKQTPAAPLVEHAGAVSAGLTDGAGGTKWKANATLDWMHRGWTLGWKVRFFDAYFLNTEHVVDPNQGSATVPSQMYHDLYGSYRFDFGSGGAFSLLSDAEVRFGINNVFNKVPPVDVSFFGFGLYYSTLGDPRQGNYYLSISKSFDRR